MDFHRAALLALGVSLSSSFVVSCKCSKDPPPIESATDPSAAPSQNLELAPEEDAGADAAPKEAKKPTGGGSSSAGSLAKCCRALRQNAESSPQKAQMLMAAGACDAAVASGSAEKVKAAVRPFAGGLPVGCL